MGSSEYAIARVRARPGTRRLVAICVDIGRSGRGHARGSLPGYTTWVRWLHAATATSCEVPGGSQEGIPVAVELMVRLGRQGME